MKVLFMAITLSMCGFAWALSDNTYAKNSGLQIRGIDQPSFLRRSPTGDVPSSSRRTGPDLASSKHSSQQGKETRPSSPKVNVPSPVARKPLAVGVVHVAHPAQGYMKSSVHGEWTTKPRPNSPSLARVDHPNRACVGGSCPGPNGILAVDVAGEKVTTKVDSRAGGTVHIADNENMNSKPQWRSFGPGNSFIHSTTAKDNNLARHHVRLEGAGTLDSEAIMEPTEMVNSPRRSPERQ